MFILMVYDVEVKRIVKVLKIGRKYLHHIQNSVLEGELSPAQYKKLKVLTPLTAVLPSSIFFVCRR